MTPVERAEDKASRDRILAIADSLVEDREAVEEQGERAEGWISFVVADRVFALPVSHIRGVHRAGHITPLPRAPQAVRGLTNLRGRVIAVLDLAVQLGLGETHLDEASRVLDSEFGRRRLGLLAERTGCLIRVRTGEIEPIEDEAAVPFFAHAKGIVLTKSGRVVLLDPELLMSSAEGNDDDS